MNVQTIQMPRLEAWNAFQVYRSALKRSWNETDATLMKGYQALRLGKPVLDVVQTIGAAGCDARYRPKLAIARADSSEVRCRVYRNGRLEFRSDGSYFSKAEKTGRIVSLPADTLKQHWTGDPWEFDCSAVLPSIPPQFRPRPERLREYHLLWEAEWADVPKDPILLKWLGKNLYAVVAQWDLTPLEQAILRA